MLVQPIPSISSSFLVSQVFISFYDSHLKAGSHAAFILDNFRMLIGTTKVNCHQ